MAGLDTFWDDTEYALSAYVSERPSTALIASVEAELGYRLPASYVTLMRSHNGGVPNFSCCPAPGRTSWAGFFHMPLPCSRRASRLRQRSHVSSWPKPA